MSNSKRIAAIVTAVGLISSGVAMADPLAAGKPAGVKQADLGSPTTLVLLGFAVVAAIAVGVASGSNGSPLPPSTPSGTTTG